jgi:uncharacterized protein YdhG (YjbR/CyaY superfamily)
MFTARISLRIVVFKLAHGVWRRRREATTAGPSAALYSVYHGLYSKAVVSSVASAVALAEVGRFREAVEYVQKAAKALYEAAREVFERVKVSLQRLAELFVEAVTRMLAWVDEHKAYLFLMTAVAAGVIALGVALNLWGLVELEKLAYAASLTPFIPAGVKEHPREEAFKILREAPSPYERFKDIAKAAIAKNEELAEPWESLRVLIMPRTSEEKRLMMSKAYRELDERKKKALFYAVLALEEAFSVYRSALRKYAVGLKETMQRVKVGEEPFKKVVYVADVGQIKQLAEEEGKAFKEALNTLRERLNEYAVRHGLGDLLDVKEDVARRLAEAVYKELPKLNDISFGVKALAALIAYREYALGRRGAFGTAAWHWLEGGGSAWLLYHAPKTAYDRAKKAGVERLAAVEELVAEALRRLFLKPGADRYSRFIKELTKGGKLALELERETKTSYVFRLHRLEEGGLKELGVELRIAKLGEGERASITYTLVFDMESWRGFFKPERETAEKAAEEVGTRLPVEERLPYMAGWVASDVAISKGLLKMSTSHLWQHAETRALFDWSVVGLRMTLTLEGPKLVVMVEAPLERLDEAVRGSAEGGWLKMLGTRAESWDGLRRWVVEHWDVVVDAAVKWLGEEIRGELEALRDRLNDDKISREVVAPVLLLLQAERLGVNETTLRYFGAAVSGAIGGDGHVSAARKEVVLTSGEREIALLWAAALAAHGIKAEVRKVGSGDAVLGFHVIVSGVGAARLAGIYFLYGPPSLEGDERVINHKLYEAMKLGAEGLDIRWEGLRQTKSGVVAADLTISEGDVAIKYNVYLSENAIELQFNSTNRGRAELAARLLRLAGVNAEVKNVGDRDVWYVEATTDRLAAGREELRKALAEIVEKARGNGWVDASKAEGWLKKLESGRVLKEGWPKYLVRLVEGALVVTYRSTDHDNIEREAKRFREMGLEEGRHFAVKTPEGGGRGYVSILKEGLERAAWLSVHGSGEQQRLAAEFINYILQRAREAGEEVYEKVREIIEEGKARGSLRLEGFEKEVEVNGRKHVVKVLGGGAEIEERQDGKKLLKLTITAEVDGVRHEYVITYGRYGKDNEARGRAYARADVPGGRKADAERLAALIKALTGKEPRVYRMKDGKITIECGRSHLDGFARYAELADAIRRWLEETGR